MPLFKKFLTVIIINLILLVSIYLLFYTYSLNNGYTYNLFKDSSSVINLGMKNIKDAFITQFIESLSDMIVYIFTFSFKNVNNNIKYYAIIMGITSLPLLLVLFKFMTYRGFQAFKMKIKKAKANPFYYRDYIEQNKDYGSNNVEELDSSLLIVLFPIRFVLMVIMIILMPVVLLIELIFELIGLLRGITNTGKALDFE